MRRRAWVVAFPLALSVLAGFAAHSSDDRGVLFLDQGADWSAPLRATYYTQDQGSRLIPLAWIKALNQPDGAPFLDGSLARYGYLPSVDDGKSAGQDLPIGFTVADASLGPTVGLTCAACHTRDITVKGRTYRIDGGPAFADFGAFIVDLDAAMQRVLTDGNFARFAKAVLAKGVLGPSGGGEPTSQAISALHADVASWSLRFHTLISRSVPKSRPWGPGRVDAIAMIYNHLDGLDLGPSPTYLLADDMMIADAPTRYPFLWNAWRQDRTQWTGFAGNGDDGLALARNLGQVIGVFADFHPEPKTGNTPLDHDYLAVNSANINGLSIAESVLTRVGPPVWPFPVDRGLAARGKAIFERPTVGGGCVACHGIAEGEFRAEGRKTWKTVVEDVGTDRHQWEILSRTAHSGSLEGASIPGQVLPLKAIEPSLNLLKIVVTGTLAQVQVGSSGPATLTQPAAPPKPDKAPPPEQPYAYEARVLQGVWAAAPYLHNGSVPSLADLLKPASERPKTFKVGPAYDVEHVGLALDQPTTNVSLATTGCEDKASGDSRCGHEFGISLSVEEKRALLEYLKTL